MSAPLKSQQELYDLFITILQTECPALTDTLDGAITDGITGAFSVGAIELQRYITAAFNKTFFDLANGPEVTGDADDLQTLAVDHFGTAFARPPAELAVDVATFTRPTNGGANCLIAAGTVVKTAADANGESQRYTTDSDVTLTHNSSGTDLTVSVAITAVVAGAAGSAAADTITEIETSLTDSTVVVTNAGNATGVDAEDDATYRETIRNLLVTLRAAVIAAIEAAAENVAGVVVASAIEIEQAVIFYDIAIQGPQSGASFFYIPFCTLYIADDTGTASDALLALVKAAVDPIKAYGVFINYVGATAIPVHWTVAITLNPSGPNYGTLSADTTILENSMKQYLGNLGIGTDFVRATAEAALLALWGPAGSNDLTAFVTTIPTGDVSIAANEIVVAGSMEIA